MNHIHHPSGRDTKPRHGVTLAAMALASTVAASTLIGVSAATAAENTVPVYWGAQYGQTLPVTSTYNESGETWVGAVATKGYTGGTQAPNGYTWCIQWSKDANGAALGDVSGTSEISGKEARIANIIIAKHAGEGSNHPEIALAVHDLFDHNPQDGRDGVNAWEYEKANNSSSAFTSLLSTSTNWIDEAEQYAQPYTLSPQFSFTDETVRTGSTGTITNLDVLSGNTSLGDGVNTVGNEIEITVELQGAVEFTSGDKKRQVFAPGGTPEIIVTGVGDYAATATTNASLPDDSVTKIEVVRSDDPSERLQDRITHHDPVSISGAVEGTSSRHTPEVETVTSAARAQPGSEIYDNLSVTGVPDGEEVTISSTLYYAGADRPQRSSSVPDTAEAVGTVETTVTGSGEFTTDTVTVEKPGYYTWVETIEETDTLDSWVSDYGITTETTVVPWSPQVSTQVSSQRIEPGTGVYDNLSVTGNKDGKELTVDSTLYGPFDHREVEGTALPEDAPVAGTVTTTVTGNGEFKTDPLVVDERGYYFWVEEIAETEETNPWGEAEDESPTWQVEETTIVPWEIESSSEISDRSSHLDGVVHDTVWFAGFPWDHAVDRGEVFLMEPPKNQPDDAGAYFLPITEDGANLDETETSTAQLTMYGPFEDMPERSEAIPEGAPVHDSVEVPAVNGEIVSGDFAEFTEAGYYTIVTDFAGSDRVEPYTSDFGIPSESTYVPDPEQPEKPGVPDEPAEPVTPEEPPTEPTTPDDVESPEKVAIDSGNPTSLSSAAWILGAGVLVLLAGLAGLFLRRKKKLTTEI